MEHKQYTLARELNEVLSMNYMSGSIIDIEEASESNRFGAIQTARREAVCDMIPQKMKTERTS